MDKDFDAWNTLKKKINNKENMIFCNPREIWWCSLGLNIGSEEDGKNQLFERPILIIKVFNKNMVRVVPFTGKIKYDRNHAIIKFNNQTESAKLSQLKTISTKRLSRKIGRLDDLQFNKIIRALRENLI
jgi:mRNA interferase MazF